MNKIALAVALAFISTAAFATGECVPGTACVPTTRVPPVKRVQNPAPVTNNSAVAVNENEITTYGGYVGQVGAQASASFGAVGSSLNVEAPKLATAPDVISYPTAPCRVSIGASGGWFGGAVGFSGSTEDENCSLRENARQLHNQGHQAAATQILCFNDDMKAALEATGTKCLVSRPPKQERVTP